jgi:hypothetical protein
MIERHARDIGVVSSRGGVVVDDQSEPAAVVADEVFERAELSRIDGLAVLDLDGDQAEIALQARFSTPCKMKERVLNCKVPKVQIWLFRLRLSICLAGAGRHEQMLSRKRNNQSGTTILLLPTRKVILLYAHIHSGVH